MKAHSPAEPTSRVHPNHLWESKPTAGPLHITSSPSQPLHELHGRCYDPCYDVRDQCEYETECVDNCSYAGSLEGPRNRNLSHNVVSIIHRSKSPELQSPRNDGVGLVETKSRNSLPHPLPQLLSGKSKVHRDW